MGVDLLKHNQDAFQEINKMIESGIKKIAVPRATGSGKTYLMGALAEKYNDDKKLVLEPTRPLLSSIKEKFDEFGIKNTDFITYQKLIRMSDEDIAEMDYKLIFLDEAHHGTAPVWGQKVDHLVATHLDSIIFGTSATTVRNDGVDVVETLFEGNAIGELPLSKAIAKKVLPCPHYITAIYRLDDEFEKLKKRIEASTNTKEEKQEFYEKMKIMQSHFEKSYGIPTILNKYIKTKDGRYLIFCKNKKHLDTMRDVVIDWFKTAGIKNVHSYAVYSDYPDKEKDYKEFCEDNSDALKILFSINMLNEGLHIKNISGVLMLRTTQSNLIYLQQLGRLVDAGNMDKYLLVFDFVNNFSSVNDGIGLLKEIKDAVAKEKESNPEFNDSGFDDIDTFFVLEQVVEIKKMFTEIEGRLEGDWENGLKHFDKYVREHDGDVLVPSDYRDEDDFWLGKWVNNRRRDFNNKRLLMDRITELEKRGFVWDVIKYEFEIKIKAVANYYKKYGEYPSTSDKGKKLGRFIIKEKGFMRNDGYPEWKREIINKYLPNFCCDTNSEMYFNKFLHYLKLYKKRYGHVNIKVSDVIDGYNIGHKWHDLKQLYRNKKLSENKISRLMELGMIPEYKHNKQFMNKMEMVRRAVKDGIVIDINNKNYKKINLYNWVLSTVKKRYSKNKISNDDMLVVEKLIGKSLYNFFNNSDYVKAVDFVKNETTIYKSQMEATRKINERYNTKMSNSIVYQRLTGKVTTPYKGRFMFYYATDEEIKKYLEDSKQVDFI